MADRRLRCSAYQQLKEFEKGLDDANHALNMLDANQGSRRLLARGHLLKG